MTHRPPVLAAAVTGVVGLAVCLVFGSDAYLRNVVFENRGPNGVDSILRTLSAPAYDQDVFGSQGASRWAFTLGFPVVLALLVLATARGANAFVAGWTAAVAAGAAAGFLRGLLLSGQEASYLGRGAQGVDNGLQLAGTGAAFGLITGVGFGLVALLAVLLPGGRRSRADDPPPAGASGPWPPAGAGDRDAAWAPAADGRDEGRRGPAGSPVRPPPPPPSARPADADDPTVVASRPPAAEVRDPDGPSPWAGPSGAGRDT